MIELPEALNLAAQLQSTVTGKAVKKIWPPTRPHRFCWFNGDPSHYDDKIKGAIVCGATGFGIFVQLDFDNGMYLCFNDGVNIRYFDAGSIVKDYQLKIDFTDGATLVFTVSMYGSLILHDGSYDNDYYTKSRNALSPFLPQFDNYYRQLLKGSLPSLSVKAFLATEQRFPGIGNGVLQDILFTAKIHPKRKIKELTGQETDVLLSAVVSVLKQMTDGRGRDTEKDLFGHIGRYKTIMSKNGVTKGCPACSGQITKEAYLGGSVYYCPTCQPLSFPGGLQWYDWYVGGSLNQ